MKTLNKWLDIEGVAKPLSEHGYAIARPTQAKMRQEGKIPFVKMGKFIRYSRDELDKWLEGHAVVKAG